MAPVELSIIIVNWNSKDYLAACLASIAAGAAGIAHEIIVVDSGSFDGCGEMLARDFPAVRFIQSPDNLGFARANNLGAAQASGEALLFLNPDTEVRGRAIVQLYRQLQRLPDAGIVGCRLLNSDGTLQTSCVQPLPTISNQVFNADILLRLFPGIGLWTSAQCFEGRQTPVQVEAISGACMLMRREVFNRVQGFSTDYFMYAEDLDLCHKTRAAGFANYYLNAAEIVHHGGGSTRQRRSRFSEVMLPESVSCLLHKTRGRLYSRCYRLALSASACIRLLLLALSWPLAVAGGRTSAWANAFGKWLVVLRWGLGRENWVRQIGAIGRQPLLKSDEVS
jgi:GT2 family glycosyltransferase